MRALALLAVSLAAAATVDTSQFRYLRELRAAGTGPVLFQADGPLFAHTRAGFADLRVVDARGVQVPWRRPPEPAQTEIAVRVLNSGRLGGRATALLDLGPARAVRDRVALELPGSRFFGRATVFGSDTRGGPFVRLATTAVYDVAGAEAHARSTVAVFPPSDFRFLRVEVSGVRSIDGATVSGRPPDVRPEPVAASVSRSEEGNLTRLVVDVRHARTPVDEVRVQAVSPRYDREVRIEASDSGRTWRPTGFGRIVHFPGALAASLPVGARARYLRLTIFNGDDAPLEEIEAVPLSRPRLLLAEGGHELPYRVLYGGPSVSAPIYDFARLPDRALPRDSFVRGTLGPEGENAAFEAPADTRSFLERNRWLVQVVLALVAVALVVSGFFALRRRT
jgi:hypothetical protein